MYFVFDPIWHSSGLCSNVEKDGGSYCPSRLPLKFGVSKEAQAEVKKRTNILTLTGNSRATEFAKEYSSMTVIDH